ncbi:MAG: aldehyde dehydrogenase family protein [Halanaerobiales bacterium]
MNHNRMYIGGKWINSKKDEVIEVINPATEETFASVPAAQKEDVEAAIDEAENSFKSWSSLSSFSRGKYLRKASKIVMNRSREIAELMTREQGKPVKEAEGEVKKGANILRYYAEEGERVYGRIVENEAEDVESRVIYQPVGVSAAISPWNYPIELLAWKIGGALAAGCTVVAKLPSDTPLSPLAFIKCLEEAGIPAGVVNAVTGRGSVTGPVLTGSPVVKKIAFTGSTEVGRSVLKGTVNSFKKVSLELGGSLPMVITRDCDLDQAVQGAVYRSFRNMGQICIAVNRIYVDREIYEQFLNKFAAETGKLTIGNGLTADCDLGPMCSREGLATTKSHIDDAVAKGAEVVCGGKRPGNINSKTGYFFEPTIIRDVNHEMLIMKEETFGPAVGVMPHNGIDEAVELANDTRYGLAAIAYTESLSTARRLARDIRAGNVSINNPSPGVINAPYGGWKDSGFGYEHGPEGLYEYLLIKHIRVKYL